MGGHENHPITILKVMVGRRHDYQPTKKKQIKILHFHYLWLSINKHRLSFPASILGLALVAGIMVAPFSLQNLGRKMTNQLSSLPTLAGWGLLAASNGPTALMVSRSLVVCQVLFILEGNLFLKSQHCNCNSSRGRPRVAFNVYFHLVSIWNTVIDVLVGDHCIAELRAVMSNSAYPFGDK